MLFNQPDTPKVPFPMGASTSSCNKYSRDPPDSISIGSAILPQLTADSAYTTRCALKRH